jgi:hypothetical protein
MIFNDTGVAFPMMIFVMYRCAIRLNDPTASAAHPTPALLE